MKVYLELFKFSEMITLICVIHTYVQAGNDLIFGFVVININWMF